MEKVIRQRRDKVGLIFEVDEEFDGYKVMRLKKILAEGDWITEILWVSYLGENQFKGINFEELRVGEYYSGKFYMDMVWSDPLVAFVNCDVGGDFDFSLELIGDINAVSYSETTNNNIIWNES